MKKGPHRIGSLLHQTLKDHPAFSANPVGNWEELVGEQIARYTRLRSLKKGVLTIVAYDSVWKHHLELNREALVEKINRGRLKEPLVEKILVLVGELPSEPPLLNPAHAKVQDLEAKRYRTQKKKKTPSRPLTSDEKALLAKIADPDLKASCMRLLKHVPLDEEGGK